MPGPEFGAPRPGLSYPDRQAAFVVVEKAGLIALVDVAQALRGLDLPGGGIDPGETPQQAAMRECAEEAGLRVAVEGEPFVFADQYTVHSHGPVHTLGQFFEARLLGEDPALRTEEDHSLVWLDPCEAIVRLDRDAHAWAVAAWLRRVRA
jgi:8-oxo-dGTP diphosphatase